MSRRAQSTNSVSLFPFLAVLVCTMGALIFLLLVTTNRIRQQAILRAEAQVVDEADAESPLPIVAAQPAPAPVPPSPRPRERVPAPVFDPNDELRERIARLARELEVRQAELSAQGGALASATEQLNTGVSRLETAEQHLRTLHEEIANGNEARQAADSKARALRQRMSELERELAAKAAQPTQTSTKYAIIPYDGSSGTTRKPILIECTEQGLRFLPENILLDSDDLQGFTIQSNPLLAGTEALVDYWRKATQRLGEPPEAAPYVLLIVRPSGSLAFYGARKLLAPLGPSWGYELVAEDWQLDLPLADPQATKACQNAIDRLINERERVLAILQDKTGRKGRRIRIDKTTGRVEVEEAPAEVAGDGSWDFADEPEQDGRNPRAVGQSRFGSEGRGTARDAFSQGTGAGNSEEPFDGLSEGSGSGTEGPAGLTAGPSAPQPPGRLPPLLGSSQPTVEQPLGQPLLATEQPRALQPGITQPRARFGGPENSETSWPVSTAEAANSAGQAGAGRERSGGDRTESAGDAPASGSPNTQRDTGTAGTSASRAATRSKVYEFGQSAGSDQIELDAEQDQSVIGPAVAQPRLRRRLQQPQQRWGLHQPQASIGFERQVMIEVDGESLHVNRQYVPIDHERPKEELVDLVLALIDEEVGSWGWPPQNFYWVPALRFVVYPGGNRYYERIQRPLRDLGLSTSVELRLKTADSSGKMEAVR